MQLRKKLAGFMLANPALKLGDKSISQWVLMDIGRRLQEYGKSMAREGWGGGIELATIAHMHKTTVYVFAMEDDLAKMEAYIPGRGGVRMVTQSGAEGSEAKANLFYVGGCHNDILREVGACSSINAPVAEASESASREGLNEKERLRDGKDIEAVASAVPWRRFRVIPTSVDGVCGQRIGHRCCEGHRRQRGCASEAGWC